MSSATYVLDHRGRRYRVGETDRDLLGHSRHWMLWGSWAAMLAVGVQQYGFGSILPVLGGARGWTTSDLLWALTLWTVCQAGVAFPAAWLRDHGLVSVRAAMITGAVLSGIGLVTLGSADDLALVVLGYSVLGGVGTGLVYATCLGTVVRWFPDQVTARTGFVSGAFAYGCTPFVLAAGFLLHNENLTAFLDVAGVLVFVVVVASGLVMKDPPSQWWPEHPQPREWALDKAHNPNQHAVRHFRPGETLRSAAAVPMYLGVAFAAAVSLFDLAQLPSFVLHGGGGPIAAAAVISVLAVVTGAARSLVGWISDRVGRSKALCWAMITGALAQFVLVYSGEHGQVPGLLIGAALAGLGTGCCYSLLVSLVREYFGESASQQNFGVLYTAKAVGGLLGVGLAGIVVVSQGYVVAFVAAGALGLVSAALTGALTQPGRPNLSLVVQ